MALIDITNSEHCNRDNYYYLKRINWKNSLESSSYFILKKILSPLKYFENLVNWTKKPNIHIFLYFNLIIFIF